MKLIYRGITYNSSPSQSVARRPFQQVRESKAAYDLIYRGMTYRVDPNAQSAKVPAKPTTYELIYRGMTYLANRTA